MKRRKATTLIEVILILFFCTILNAEAQVQFAIRYSNAGAFYGIGPNVERTLDSNYIFTGQSNNDLLITKVTNYGDTIWSKRYGRPYDDRMHWISPTSDSGYVAVGTVNWGTVSSNILLLRLKPNGDTLWVRSYGSIGQDEGLSVHQSDDQYFYVSGTYKYDNVNGKIWLLKIKPNGDTLWSKAYILNSSSYQFCWHGEITSDGGYVMMGRTQSTHLFVLKTDSLGVVQWSKIYSQGTYDVCEYIRETSDGGYIITGWTTNSVAWPYDYDMYVLKIDSTGTVMWSKIYKGTANNDWAARACETLDGGYMISGNLSQGSVLIKTDINGDTLWTRANSYFNSATNIMQTGDGGYIWSNGIDELCKTDSLGNIGCQDLSPAINVLSPLTIETNANATESPHSFSVQRPDSFTVSNVNIQVIYCFTVDANGIENSNSMALSLFPNPSTGSFTIALSEEYKIHHIELKIYDVMGKEIYSTSLNSKLQTLNPKLAGGIYFVKVCEGDRVWTQKLVIE